jgi:nitric oxide reductase NorQ protein
MLDFLRQEGISEDIIKKIEDFRVKYPISGELGYRVPEPKYRYYGREVWEEAATALLSGENLLLVGPKATGKNVLAENLACVFGRPEWDISFYLNTDAASLIGTDTFKNGEVTLRRGPIYQCAENGGFGVLDEINMAKNESLAVLHATLDFRRIIDVPGYDRIELAPLHPLYRHHELRLRRHP